MWCLFAGGVLLGASFPRALSPPPGVTRGRALHGLPASQRALHGGGHGSVTCLTSPAWTDLVACVCVSSASSTLVRGGCFAGQGMILRRSFPVLIFACLSSCWTEAREEMPEGSGAEVIPVDRCLRPPVGHSLVRRLRPDPRARSVGRSFGVASGSKRGSCVCWESRWTITRSATRRWLVRLKRSLPYVSGRS